MFAFDGFSIAKCVWRMKAARRGLGPDARPPISRVKAFTICLGLQGLACSQCTPKAKIAPKMNTSMRAVMARPWTVSFLLMRPSLLPQQPKS